MMGTNVRIISLKFAFALSDLLLFYKIMVIHQSIYPMHVLHHFPSSSGQDASGLYNCSGRPNEFVKVFLDGGVFLC